MRHINALFIIIIIIIQSASLRNLTLKTLFLIAIASGRRCSELHALVIGGRTVFSNAGVTLYFKLGFLAKNEISNFLASPLFIPYLNSSKRRSKRLNCPVRALKWYLDRTRTFRGDVTQIFITSTKPYRAAAKSTMAGWLVEVIKNSSAIEGESDIPTAHSIRATSSSWAFARGLSIADIINTISWRSDSTFIKVYLKDIQTRGSHGRYANLVLGAASSQ